MSKVIDYLVTKRDDMLLFALSLFIAWLLFGQVQGGMEPGKEREFEVPLAFANQSDDVSILQAPRFVRVVASGSEQVLDSLETSRVRAFVDLAQAKPGVGRYKIEVVGPQRSGLTLSPSRTNAELELEEKLRKTFEVQLITVGTPPGTYTYNGVTMIPSEVEVSGPKSNVQRVQSVRAVLDLTTISPRRTIEAEVEALGDEDRPVPLITIDPTSVQILPAISIGPSQRNLLVTPVFTGQPAVGYKVSAYEVTPNQIATVGESEEVSRVTTVNTRPIDLAGLRTDRTFRIQLVLPPGIEAVNGDHVVVTVRVSKS